MDVTQAQPKEKKKKNKKRISKAERLAKRDAKQRDMMHADSSSQMQTLPDGKAEAKFGSLSNATTSAPSFAFGQTQLQQQQLSPQFLVPGLSPFSGYPSQSQSQPQHRPLGFGFGN